MVAIQKHCKVGKKQKEKTGLNSVGSHWKAVDRQPGDTIHKSQFPRAKMDGVCIGGWRGAGQTNKNQDSRKLAGRGEGDTAITGDSKIDQKGWQQGTEMVRRTNVDLKSQPRHCFYHAHNHLIFLGIMRIKGDHRYKFLGLNKL